MNLTQIRIPFPVLFYSVAVACRETIPGTVQNCGLPTIHLYNISVPELIVFTQTSPTFTIIKNELKRLNFNMKHHN